MMSVAALHQGKPGSNDLAEKLTPWLAVARADVCIILFAKGIH